jgi:RNA polymerase primary sigma factor
MAKLRELKISNEKFTNRTDNTNRYFNEIEKIKMLSPDDEFKVATEAQKGNKEAIDKLVRANLRFVVSVAKQYSNSETSLDDLICQGNIGLIYAAETFDPTRGFKFISYAVWHIRREILQYFTVNSRTVKIPQNIITTLGQIKKIDESMLQMEGRTATIEEIQEHLANGGKVFSESQIKGMLVAESRVSALESTDFEDGISPIEWISSDSSAADRVKKIDQVIVTEQMLSVLKPVQKEVVARRLGIGLPEPETLATISERFDRTPEWARQVYDQAIRKMKARFIRRASYLNVE